MGTLKDNPQHGSESTGDRSKFTVDINVGDGPEFEYEWRYCKSIILFLV